MKLVRSGSRPLFGGLQVPRLEGRAEGQRGRRQGRVFRRRGRVPERCKRVLTAPAFGFRGQED